LALNKLFHLFLFVSLLGFSLYFSAFLQIELSLSLEFLLAHSIPLLNLALSINRLAKIAFLNVGSATRFLLSLTHQELLISLPDERVVSLGVIRSHFLGLDLVFKFLFQRQSLLLNRLFLFSSFNTFLVSILLDDLLPLIVSHSDALVVGHLLNCVIDCSRFLRACLSATQFVRLRLQQGRGCDALIGLGHIFLRVQVHA
jgi:hypothetical protein